VAKQLLSVAAIAMPPKNAQAMWVLHPETASQNGDCRISSGAEPPFWGCG